MKKAVACIRKVQGNEIKNLVARRIKQFHALGTKPSKEIFKELCFCILTANYTAEGGVRIQNEIGDGFLTLSETGLSAKLRQLRYRFPNVRAKYIVEARKHANSLKEVIESSKDSNELREWLVKNVKGIGFKEASHFMRNIGFRDVAIIDFHIVDFLHGFGLIKKPKTLTRNKYLEIEKVLKEVAKFLNLSLAELDLYMWYCETGKILK